MTLDDIARGDQRMCQARPVLRVSSAESHRTALAKNSLNSGVETRNATSEVRETRPRKLPKILFEAHQLLVDFLSRAGDGRGT